MKKIIMILLIVFFLVGCSETKELKTDAVKFKEEYEALNDKETSYGDNTYRTLAIEDDNPIIYKEASDILEMIDDGKTFAVYFGFASCPWCRSVISNLIDVSNDLKIETIYYVDVKEIRDTLKLNEDGNVVTEQKGTDDYYELLEKLETVLEDYTLTDENGNEINTEEKRIYAPNIVSVVNGVPTKMTTGISDKQTDAYMELTEEITNESYDKIKCTIECVVEEKEVCTVDKKC
ncbi:MAG: hypothetical protein IJ509_02365 [Bacilli bacterium]|nr:hypothetical protein [Bacilli bacterium]